MSAVVPGVGLKGPLRTTGQNVKPVAIFRQLIGSERVRIGLGPLTSPHRGTALFGGNMASRIRIMTHATSALEPTPTANTPQIADVKWACSLLSFAPLLGDTSTGLEIVVLDADSDLRSSVAKVENWLPPQLIQKKNGNSGWLRDGPITVPAAIHKPGAVMIRKLPSPTGKDSVDYISQVDLVNANNLWQIPVESWISSAHGWRVFFTAEACLPKDTPASLLEERARDLAEQQGTPESRVLTRKGADRIYWYQTYNDLGSVELPRPPLGGSKMLPYPRRLATNRGDMSDGSEKPPPKGDKPWLPFDEQFSFNKAAGFDGDTLEGSLAAAFAVIGEIGNNPNLTLLNLVPTAVRGIAKVLIGLLPFVEGPLDNFEDYNDVLAMFKLDAERSPNGFKSIQPTNLYPANAPRGLAPAAAAAAAGALAKPFKKSDGAWDFRLDRRDAEVVNLKTAEARVGPVYDSATGTPAAGARGAKDRGGEPPKPGAISVADRLGTDLWRRVKASSGDVNDLLYFNVPRVLDNRPDAWYTDEEFGRQALAGYNPVTVTSLTQTPESFGSAIRGEHINAELQGSTLEELVAEAAAGGKPRLYVQDYWAASAFWEEEAAAEAAGKKKPKGRVEHQGRAIFYLQKDDMGRDIALVPVAIELAHRETHSRNPGLPASAGIVYSRAELAGNLQTLAIWRLAKAVFKSIDFSVHEVYSHFTRSHAVMEPFLISMRRNISTMHPIFKLMLPHFRYTLNINRNARTSLINAGGIIEQCFTPGDYALRLGAVLYGATWTFANQALPDDLKSRGMLGPDGQPWLNYPFATDGLDIWAALKTYFDSYLSIYYKSDEDVAGDSELQAWWQEVKTEGHPDLVAFGLRTEEEVWGFTGPIASLERLVHVLTTIAWIGSGHHAAVNFGQYDYVSFILNTSSLIRQQMPAKGEKAYKELVEAGLGEPQERIIMKYLVDPLSAAKVMATVQLLSAHADDEQTLDERNNLLVDPPAIAANEAFAMAMKLQSAVVLRRNADPANWARFNLEGTEDDNFAPLPYTLLQPSSGAGITMRGVPYSVSI